jgi:HlyD family secretion protein
MKRVIIPVIVIALASTAFYFRDRWLPPPPGQTEMLGYVEGETVMIASPVAGRIVERHAEKGASVKAGEVLFRIDPAAQQAEVDRTQAAVATAGASLANLLSGKRAPEQDIVRAQRRETEAALVLAREELVRATELSTTGTASKTRYDTAVSQVAQLEARIGQIDATLAAGDLGGREQEIAAARSRVAEAQAAAAAAAAKLADLSPLAPLAANVDDTFYDVGEWVPAGQPIVSLLAPDDVKLRFFVPEAALASASPGITVHYRCDGCNGTADATITSVAATPEYTPPVIYSQGARAKLVFMVEAKPAVFDSRLRPGLPIEVEPLP